ncbi:MAG: fused MFS/spermidine synthase [Saprospiraceae bacterium]|jgi:spermidine synthase|nr:fused MFS/spermidine synthase [Saprospiraceae bacterium]
MKPGIIKKYLSYVTELLVETVQSNYNETLEVLLSHGRYQLCTPNAVYSYGDKYNNYRDCFKQLVLDKHDLKNVLILGFGLGSIPVLLEKTFKKSLMYTGVEIDEAIIYLVSKYVLDEVKSEISLIHADAANFVMQNHFIYDMICIDIFIDDKIPEHFISKQFLENVITNVAINGIILFNHLGHSEADITAAQRYYKDVFSQVIPNAKMIKVNHNFMMVSNPDIWIKK